jgi:D-alanyl-D-alanine carboxypeptidase
MRRPPSFRSRLAWFLALFLIALCAGAVLLGAARAAVVPPPAGLPACEVAERPAPHSFYSEWDSTLLDPALTLGRSYVPPDLRTVRVRGQAVTLRDFVIGPLRSLLAAASDVGVRAWVTSSYRSFADQERLVAVNPDSEDEVARAGHSEHQLGTALDLGGDTDWLRLNAPRFGFVLSYPADRSPKWTCYRAEPWHFRYFGPERAQQVTKSGLSLREWLWAEGW